MEEFGIMKGIMGFVEMKNLLNLRSGMELGTAWHGMAWHGIAVAMDIIFFLTYSSLVRST